MTYANTTDLTTQEVEPVVLAGSDGRQTDMELDNG